MATPPSDSARRRRSFWGWCRCSFRWCRIGVLGLILLVLSGLTWLRVAGLPEFLRVRIVAELRQRGVEADFSSLRFHWFRGLVATDLRVAWSGPQGPRVSIAEADLDLAPPPWRERQDLVRGLRVRRGAIAVPLPLTNEPPAEIQVENVAADLRFLPGDAWEIRQLEARSLGLDLRLRATLTNLAGLRTSPRPPASPEASAHRIRLIRAIAEELSRWSSETSPRAEVSLVFDGLQPASAHGDVYLSVPSVRTPRGDVNGLKLSLRVIAPEVEPSAAARSSLTAELEGVQTGDGGAERVTVRADFTGPSRPSLPTNVTWAVAADHVFLRGFRTRELVLQGTNDLLAEPAGVARSDLENVPVASRLHARARSLDAARLQGEPVHLDGPELRIDARHPLADPWSASLPGQPGITRPAAVASLALRAASASGAPGRTGPVAFDANLRVRSDPPEPAPTGVAAWALAWPFSGAFSLRVSDVRSPKIEAESLDLGAEWKPPALTLHRWEARLGGGTARVSGNLDVPSRQVRIRAETDFDLHVIDPLLRPRSLENFRRYQWAEPPWANAEAWATLPPWDARNPDWERVVKPTAGVRASVRVGKGSFKSVPFDSAKTSLNFDGTRLVLPDLVTTRPEGTQHLVVDYDTDTKEYRVDGRGPILPPVLRPLIGEKSAEVLDLFGFQQAVDAQVSVWGPWSEGTSQSIAGTVFATNFTFRGHRLDRMDASVLYTNRTLIASPARLTRDAGVLTVEGVRYEFDPDLLILTNAVNTIDPAVVAAAISPGFPEKLRHYRFDTPPTVRVEGRIHPRQPGTADLTFDIQGGPFRFWRFSAPQIATRMDWRGQFLTFTNVQASFYRGSLTGNAQFDLSTPDDGTYRFSARVRNSDLGELLHEATFGKTNVAQGTFDLDLDILTARTSDLWTWNGVGRADLRDGLLWDTPIFGFLSPILNTASPGLGNNRAKRAEATFTVTNGVFHTRDLTIACPPANLLYRGSIDLDQRVNAKVEAEVLGNVAGFGPLFGLVLKPLTKLLEFRVTGTLTKFETQPLYVPRFLLLPLQPFKMIRDVFGAGDSVKTNAPPTP